MKKVRTMRGDRLVSILLLLQAHGRMTAKQLAQRLEVSERTIYRDMEALSRSGIPVIADRGANGGWSLLENYQTNLTGLKEAELRALFISLSPQLLNELGLRGNAEEAGNKLIASLPAMYRDRMKDIWNRIHIDTSTWRIKREEVTAFEVLKQAIWQDYKLQIHYQRADGKANERIVMPLGLVAKGSRWYFIAAKENGDIRNYRAARIISATVLHEKFARPASFNLAQYWHDSTSAFIEKLPTYEVSVEAAPAIMPALQFTGRFVQVVKIGSKNQQGWTPVQLSFNSEEEAKRYLLGFADQIKVIEPADLHAQLIIMAEAALAFYRK